MRINIILLLIFPCFFSVLSGQCGSNPAVFGKISLGELTRQYDEKDSTAAAVVLSDVGKSYFEYDQEFKIRHVREVRIKVYSKPGLDWANVSIPYYIKDLRNAEIVKDIEANTYNIENGLIVKKEMDKHAVYDNKINDKWSEKVFALPDVKEGSVIEYRYTVISPFLFNLRDWQFQYDIPVRWTEYEVKIPGFFQYQMLYQGYEPLAVNESEILRAKKRLGSYEYQDIRYKWALKDVPAFKDESFITTEEDYLAKMIFQLSKVDYPDRRVKEYMTTWPALIRDFLKLSDYGKNLKKDAGEDRVNSLTNGLSSEIEKAAAIYNFVKSNIAWNGKSSIYPSKSPKKVLQDKSGNCTDINIMLHNMLRMAGIDVKPVLLSTRSHGHINPKFPLIDDFNYSLVYMKIGDTEYLLDATDPDLPLGMIPMQCINGYGLLMHPGEEKWLTLHHNNEYNISTYVLLHYDTLQENFTAQVNNIYRGYAAAMQRKEYNTTGEAVVDDQHHLTSEDLEMIDLKNIEKPLIMRFSLPYPHEQLGGNIYLDPAILSSFHENPFKAPERSFPVDYGYVRTYRYMLNLEIPEGYKADEMPEPVTLSLEDNSVQFVMQSQANDLNVQILGIVKISHPVIEAKYYPKLREIYSTILSKYAEKIVLKKVSGLH